MPKIFRKYTHEVFSFSVVTVVPDEAELQRPFSYEMDLGMLATCLSRTSTFVDGIIEKILAGGSDDFYKRVFLGYGHKSSADGVPVAVFVQGISMIAAKLLEECSLMNLQESSTRAINFAKARFLLASEDADTRTYVEKLRAFYSKVVSVMTEKIAQEQNIDMTPTQNDSDQLKELRRSVRYAAMDIARGYLPAGCVTDVGIVMSARPFIEHLTWMDCVPNPEVKALSQLIRLALKERYPGVFHEYSVKPEDELEDELCRKYRQNIVEQEFQQSVENCKSHAMMSADSAVEVILTARPNPSALRYSPYRTRRPYNPDKSWLCMELSDDAAALMPLVLIKAKLGWTEWREVQRHRPAKKNLPILTTFFGPEDFYIESLDPSLIGEALELIGEACRLSEKSPDTLGNQYFIPMLFSVPVVLDCSWDVAAYIISIRSGPTVHPALRRSIITAGDLINHHPLVENLLEYYPGLRMEFDERPTVFQKRRGKATILMKSGNEISAIQE